MKKINEYNSTEVKNAYEGIKLGLVLNVSEPLVINHLLEALEQIKVRANELGIVLK